MNCQHHIERLPWLRNGSLPEAEARDLRVHLKQCEACASAWREILEVEKIFESHLDSEALVDLAFGEGDCSPWETQHLARCSQCAEELALVRNDLVPEKAPQPAPWRRYSVAATFAIALLGGVLWNQMKAPEYSSSVNMAQEESSSWTEDTDSMVFADGFESGDLNSWSTASTSAENAKKLLFSDGFESGSLDGWSASSL